MTQHTGGEERPSRCGVELGQGFVDACRSGLGWGLNPAKLVLDHLASGALVEIVPNTTLDVPLFWQISRLVADRLQGLTQAVLAAAEGKLERS